VDAKAVDRHRVKNNTFKAASTGVPCYTLRLFAEFFNHSCFPNVVLSNTNFSSEERLVAMRSIRKDEETFVCYFSSDVAAKSKAERRKALSPWMATDCQCIRCRRG
jgi:SET domain-containing protein